MRWSETQHGCAGRPGFKAQPSHVLVSNFGPMTMSEVTQAFTEPRLPICEVGLLRVLPQGVVSSEGRGRAGQDGRNFPLLSSLTVLVAVTC